MTQLVAAQHIDLDPVLEPVEVLGAEDRQPSRIVARMGRQLAALRGVSHLGTWIGVTTSAVGLVLIAIAWGRTAGLTNVALQVPYVVSAGFTGLGLVVIGLTVVSITAKQADAAARTRQLRELREVLVDLRTQLEERR